MVLSQFGLDVFGEMVDVGGEGLVTLRYLSTIEKDLSTKLKKMVLSQFGLDVFGEMVGVGGGVCYSPIPFDY